MSTIQPHNYFCHSAEIFQNNIEAFEDTIFLINISSWADYLDYHIQMLKEELVTISPQISAEMNQYFEEVVDEINEAKEEQRKNNLKLNYLLS